MARFYPLFSSSEGNSYFVGGKSFGILIDIGVSYRRLVAALHRYDIDISAVRAVFITHEHGDHIKGISMFSTKNPEIPVYSLPAVSEEILKKNMNIPVKNIEEDEEIIVGDVQVRNFRTSHDSKDSCGYRIILSNDEKECVICTDLGIVTEEVERAILGADLVLIESNYDVEMLRNSSYPFHIKARIFSKKGHLSNDDCGRILLKLLESGTRRFVLGHLSLNNNTPLNAERTAERFLGEYTRNKDYMLTVLEKEHLGDFITF